MNDCPAASRAAMAPRLAANHGSLTIKRRRRARRTRRSVATTAATRGATVARGALLAHVNVLAQDSRERVAVEIHDRVREVRALPRPDGARRPQTGGDADVRATWQ